MSKLTSSFHFIFYFSVAALTEESTKEEYGRGRRARNVVTYSDPLLEIKRQFRKRKNGDTQKGEEGDSHQNSPAYSPGIEIDIDAFMDSDDSDLSEPEKEIKEGEAAGIVAVQGCKAQVIVISCMIVFF